MATPFAVNSEAFNARAVALADFLDLKHSEWEAWLQSPDAVAGCPTEVHPIVADVISSFRSDADRPADADPDKTTPGQALYLRAVAMATTDVLVQLTRMIRAAR